MILISPLLHRELGNIGVAEWADGKKGTVYFGTTGQALTMEHLRFMTARGANVKGKCTGRRNRPVLIWAKTGAVIKQSECIKMLKIQSIVLYECKPRHNACLFEEICQETYQPGTAARNWKTVQTHSHGTKRKIPAGNGAHENIHDIHEH